MNNSVFRLGTIKFFGLGTTCLALVLGSAGCSAAAGSEPVDTGESDGVRLPPPGIEAELNLHQDVESGPETVAENVAALSESAELAAGAFTSIVALSNCSGSFVRFTTSKPTDRAMVLTNGHCFEGGLIKAGTAVANRSSRRTFRLLNASGSGNLGRLTASRVLYGTMTYTDMLLYELTETFQQVTQRLRVEPLTITDKRPDASEEILIPSGYWRRTYSCAIDTFVHELREGTWTFKDSIKYTEPGCEVIGGTSGSPILRAATREVIGINNTGNMDGARCTVNNPCEVDEEGSVVVDKGGSYGQQLYLLYACLTADNTFDLNRPGCVLTKP